MWGREAGCHSGHRSIREVPTWQGAGWKKDRVAWWLCSAFVVGAQGRPQVYQLRKCGRGTVSTSTILSSFKKIYSSKNLQSWFSAKCLPPRQLLCNCLFKLIRLFILHWTMIMGEGYCMCFFCRYSYSDILMACLTASDSHGSYESSSVRGFSGNWLYCSARSCGLQGKCFPRWAGNWSSCRSCTLIARHLSNTQWGNTFLKSWKGAFSLDPFQVEPLESWWPDIFECDFDLRNLEKCPPNSFVTPPSFMKRQRELWLLPWPAHVACCISFGTAMIIYQNSIFLLSSVVSTVLFQHVTLGITCALCTTLLFEELYRVCMPPPPPNHKPQYLYDTSKKNIYIYMCVYIYICVCVCVCLCVCVRIIDPINMYIYLHFWHG